LKIKDENLASVICDSET